MFYNYFIDFKRDRTAFIQKWKKGEIATTLTIVTLLVLTTGIFVGTQLSQDNTDIRSSAEDFGDEVLQCDGGLNPYDSNTITITNNTDQTIEEMDTNVFRCEYTGEVREGYYKCEDDCTGDGPDCQEGFWDPGASLLIKNLPPGKSITRTVEVGSCEIMQLDAYNKKVHQDDSPYECTNVRSTNTVPPGDRWPGGLAFAIKANSDCSQPFQQPDGSAELPVQDLAQGQTPTATPTPDSSCDIAATYPDSELEIACQTPECQSHPLCQDAPTLTPTPPLICESDAIDGYCVNAQDCNSSGGSLYSSSDRLNCSSTQFCCIPPTPTSNPSCDISIGTLSQTEREIACGTPECQSHPLCQSTPTPEEQPTATPTPQQSQQLDRLVATSSCGTRVDILGDAYIKTEVNNKIQMVRYDPANKLLEQLNFNCPGVNSNDLVAQIFKILSYEK